MGRLPAKVFLTGFMGSGKSTVGRALAEALGWKFVDTDALVEQAAGCPVAAVFRERGETGFRFLETQAVATACGLENHVVALGGGALVSVESRDRVLESGLVIWLDASPEELAKRADTSTRPLLRGLRGAALVSRIGQLAKERRGSYQAAHVRLPTDGLSPDDVVKRALAEVQAWKR